MKFIHTSDIRLFASLNEASEWEAKRKKEVEGAFDRIIDDCNEKDIDLLLIAGNLFDAPPDEEKLQYVDEKLAGLIKTRTVILPGSLDYISPGSHIVNYSFTSRTVLLPPDRTMNAYLRGINTCVTGFGYGYPEYTENMIGRIEPGRKGAVNILLAAGGDEKHMPFKPADIVKKGFDYVAMGGRSKPAHILKNRLAYSGCPEPLGPSETGRRGYITGEITDEGTKIGWTASNVRSYMDISINLSPSLTNEDVTSKLEEMLLKLGNENIYTIIFKGFAGEDFSPDLKRIRERYYIRLVEDLTISGRDEERLLEENSTNLMGSYINSVKNSYTIDENIRAKALRYGLEALIMSGED